MIEALDLLAEDEILQQSRSSLANTETVLVFDGTADVGCHIGVIIVEVELRQEFFRGSSCIVGRRIAGLKLASHIRTSSIGKANKTWDGQSESAHRVGGSAFSDAEPLSETRTVRSVEKQLKQGDSD